MASSALTRRKTRGTLWKRFATLWLRSTSAFLGKVWMGLRNMLLFMEIGRWQIQLAGNFAALTPKCKSWRILAATQTLHFPQRRTNHRYLVLIPFTIVAIR